MSLKECSVCKREISPEARTCPGCGQPRVSLFFQVLEVSVYFWIVSAAALIVLKIAGSLISKRYG